MILGASHDMDDDFEINRFIRPIWLVTLSVRGQLSPAVQAGHGHSNHNSNASAASQLHCRLKDPGPGRRGRSTVRGAVADPCPAAGPGRQLELREGDLRVIPTRSHNNRDPGQHYGRLLEGRRKRL